MPENDTICCHGYDMITSPLGAIHIHHSTDSETDIQWRFIK